LSFSVRASNSNVTCAGNITPQSGRSIFNPAICGFDFGRMSIENEALIIKQRKEHEEQILTRMKEKSKKVKNKVISRFFQISTPRGRDLEMATWKRVDENAPRKRRSQSAAATTTPPITTPFSIDDRPLYVIRQSLSSFSAGSAPSSNCDDSQDDEILKLIKVKQEELDKKRTNYAGAIEELKRKKREHDRQQRKLAAIEYLKRLEEKGVYYETQESLAKEKARDFELKIEECDRTIAALYNESSVGGGGGGSMLLNSYQSGSNSSRLMRAASPVSFTAQGSPESIKTTFDDQDRHGRNIGNRVIEDEISGNDM
jgi:hypothetical protein